MWGEAKVVERIDWSDQLFTLKLSADIGEFIAGQFIKLSLHIDDKRRVLGGCRARRRPPNRP